MEIERIIEKEGDQMILKKVIITNDLNEITELDCPANGIVTTEDLISYLASIGINPDGEISE